MASVHFRIRKIVHVDIYNSFDVHNLNAPICLNSFQKYLTKISVRIACTFINISKFTDARFVQVKSARNFQRQFLYFPICFHHNQEKLSYFAEEENTSWSPYITTVGCLAAAGALIYGLRFG